MEQVITNAWSLHCPDPDWPGPCPCTWLRRWRHALLDVYCLLLLALAAPGALCLALGALCLYRWRRGKGAVAKVKQS